MSHLGIALREFRCGPGSHAFEDTGILFGEASSVADGQRIPQPTEALPLCSVCLKDGRNGTCGFCGEPSELYDEVASPTGETLEVAACSICHIDLIDHNDTEGWTFIRIAPPHPDDP